MTEVLDRAPEAGTSDRRVRRGYLAHRTGLAAEAQVAAHYQSLGYTVLAERWRGRGGEIDLVVRRGDIVVFVEVKKARSLDAAAARLSARQLHRLIAAGEEFLGEQPGGLLTDARVDLATVGGLGEVSILENISL